MSEELKATYAKLTLRPKDFERILLEEIGFKSVEQLSAGTGQGELIAALHMNPLTDILRLQTPTVRLPQTGGKLAVGRRRALRVVIFVIWRRCRHRAC